MTCFLIPTHFCRRIIHKMEPTSTATLVTPESIPIPELEKEPPSTGISCGSSRLKINRRRQEGNPLNKYIRNVPYEWNSEIKCDFECSRNCGVLYLSLKYHKLHPGYIETRLNDLNGYQVKVLLALTNVEDPSFLLRDLNILCYRTRITLTLCYSVEEAAEYIESFKITENKSVEKTLSAIQQRKAEWLSNRTT